MLTNLFRLARRHGFGLSALARVPCARRWHAGRQDALHRAAATCLGLTLAIGVAGGRLAKAQPLLSYRFDASTEAWTAIDVPSAELCAAVGSGATQASGWRTGGHPGGCFYYREPSNTGIDPLLRAPGSIAGDFAAAYGGFVRFDRRFLQTNWFDFPIVDDLYIQGMVDGQAVTLISNTGSVPYNVWQAMRVPLLTGEWTVGSCGGAIATPAEIAAVLAGLTGVKIKAEYRSGLEDHYVDNFMILPPDAAVSTSFTADAGEWTVAGDFSSFGWIAAEGIENVRCFKVVDAVQGRGMSFVAPTAYLGDKSIVLGRTMEFDLKSSVGFGAVQADGGSGGFVTLRSASKSLFFRNMNLPIVGNYWRHQAVPLTPTPFWTRSNDGAAATTDDFIEVLSALTGVLVRAEFETGGEATYLDNVVFGTCSPSGTASPALSAACPGTTTTFAVQAAGAAPFSYRWTRDGVEIDPAINPSAASAMLSVQANTGSDGGAFRCIISNACGSVTSNPATLTVCIADVDDGSGTGNPDCGVTIEDLLYYIGLFDQGDVRADVDDGSFTGTPDGGVTIDDLLYYLFRFDAGC